jgi:hypothetical protein
MCGLSSFFVLFLGTFLVHTTSEIAPRWQAYVIGCITVISAALTIGDVFYMNPETLELRKHIKEHLKTMTPSQAKEYLKSQLPEIEYTAIYWHLYEKMPIADVAIFKMNCSERTVRTELQSAYKRINTNYDRRQ